MRISKIVGKLSLEQITHLKAVEQRKFAKRTNSHTAPKKSLKLKIRRRKRVIKPLMQTPFAGLSKLINFLNKI